MVNALCSALLGTGPQTHILEPQRLVEPERLPLLEDALGRLLKEEPLQYVLGEAWFLGRRFKVSPAVLIPRPETEEMVDMALRLWRRKTGNVTGDGAEGYEAAEAEGMCRGNKAGVYRDGRGPKVLDLCTGSGCIAWSMALELPGAGVLGVDISPIALEVAASQFRDSRVRPQFIEADVLQPEHLLSRLAEADGLSAGRAAQEKPQFDIFLSNPPYVRESERTQMRANVLDWEPGLALFVPDSDALRFYSAEAEIAAAVLRRGGFGLVEINEAFGPEVAELFRRAGLGDVRILQDLSGRDRFVSFSAE